MPKISGSDYPKFSNVTMGQFLLAGDLFLEWEPTTSDRSLPRFLYLQTLSVFRSSSASPDIVVLSLFVTTITGNGDPCHS